jgi:ribosomal protein S18 acetylase RimI-like enzyme
MGAIEAVRAAALKRLPRLLVHEPEAVAILLADAPGTGKAGDGGSLQRHAVEVFGGQVMLTHGSAMLGWLPDPALAIGSWLVLGDGCPPASGGVAVGLAHAHDLLHATIEEAGALAELAAPGQLMVPFDVSGVVDLRDARFSVESPERGSLVPWSCRLIRRVATPATVRNLAPDDAGTCDEIVAGLPDWFGDEQGIRTCAEAVRTQPGAVAELDGEVAGFLTWERDGDGAEITWMAVRADRRRRGLGRALLDALMTMLRADGVRELRVKTLSARVEDEPYAETRAFYAAMGFTEARELDVWGPENPAVLLTRPL